MTLRKALDDSGIKWRVIVVSACHSGAFIPALADESTAGFASAAADRASFGCGDDREITEFGAAFLRDALPRATSLETAFEQAKAALAEGEGAPPEGPAFIAPVTRRRGHLGPLAAHRGPARSGFAGGEHADRPNTPGRTRAARMAG